MENESNFLGERSNMLGSKARKRKEGREERRKEY